ncbi:MAG: aminotransferase class V-fold PLP-dependent enzyme [Alphaproteobacteria bacterium]|nr:aminotransferase class V-fold PLP-dependent enzyme [Alphaproteobacteria bacterium]
MFAGLLSTKVNADPIYLDYQATTPVDSRVLESMLPYFTKEFGNPHSTTHVYGTRSHEAIEQARAQVASIINADPQEIIFTSGATEADNIAILGVSRALKNQGKYEIISVVTEHKAVLEPLKVLEQEGFKVIFLPVQKNGIIDINDLKKALSSKTALVSVMAVNNEIGVLQPIREIAKLAHEHGALFHTDAAQGFGKIPLDVTKDDIDLLSLSGHKIYGPKGVGALFIKRGTPVIPLVYGGGQERKIRPGTVPTPLCVGLGKAAQIAEQERLSESKRLLALRNKLLNTLQKNLTGVLVNGDLEKRLPGNLNLSFTGVDSAPLLANLKGIAISASSACSSDSLELSYVIKAIDHDHSLPPAIIRLSLGRSTTEAEVEKAAEEIIRVVSDLRDKNPTGGGRSCKVEDIEKIKKDLLKNM